MDIYVDRINVSGMTALHQIRDVVMTMLRRASVDIDVDRINMLGMTALHQVRDASEDCFASDKR